MTRIYVTKWATTAGILEKELHEVHKETGSAWDGPPGRIETNYYSKNEWFLERADAIKRARSKILARLRSIRKETEKLRQMDAQLAEEQRGAK